MSQLCIEILDETRTVPEETLAWLTKQSQIAVRRLGCRGDLRVRVVADAAMAAAHEEFTGISGTTDVLTFDMSEPVEPNTRPLPTAEQASSDSIVGLDGLDADILICIDEAKRQAGARDYPFERELLLYVIHGVLHCMGFDDHDEAAFSAMHAMEDAVLQAIGVGPVFHRPYVGEQL